jgi:hypothetical protein
MSAHTLLERLCSLVPRPHTNQILYRGVLAPNSARREKVVPELPEYARPKNATFCELMKHGLGLDVLACLRFFKRAASACGTRLRSSTGRSCSARSPPRAYHTASIPSARRAAAAPRLWCLNDVRDQVRGRGAPAVQRRAVSPPTRGPRRREAASRPVRWVPTPALGVYGATGERSGGGGPSCRLHAQQLTGRAYRHAARVRWKRTAGARGRRAPGRACRPTQRALGRGRPFRLARPIPRRRASSPR